MDEFDFIRMHLSPLAGPEGLGLMDDAACLTPQAGYDLILTKDTMVEGVHFPKGYFGEKVAGKLLRVNLSDIAAKGAKAKGYLLSLAWPDHLSTGDLRTYGASFAKGLEVTQNTYGATLYGGDTVKTSGPMVVTATFIGQVPCGTMVKRSGAKTGDDVWVSGTIGDAYLGLKSVMGEASFCADETAFFEAAYWTPTPRLELGDFLRDYANSAADISDGLLADVGHIAAASQICVNLDVSAVPISKAARNWMVGGEGIGPLQALLTGGDDYEVVFTAPPNHRARVADFSAKIGVPITHIGVCGEGRGVVCKDESGETVTFERGGYRHF